MIQEDYKIDAFDRIDGVADPRENLTLLGHQTELDFLADKFANGTLHHAWLISGPQGIGKATFAFRFAEHLLRTTNDQTPPERFSFQDDAVHSQVSKGAHPNIKVLRRPYDQKTKKFKTVINVEEVRSAVRFFETSRGVDAWRICIVDPADDLNTSAANALLKVLEEPPQNTIFLVLAHSPRGLLPTIRSRCQSLNLKPLNDATLKKALSNSQILDDKSDDEIEDLIHLSKGSVRRAILLSQSQAVVFYKDFIKNVEHSSPDMAALYKLAGALSLASKADEFKLFIELIFDHLSNQLKDPNTLANKEKLQNIAQVWEDTKTSLQTMQTWNMDKKQTILSLFHAMHSI
ncbi:MAG: DNA polymerase III subunit delta' [Nitratireductor sp.]